MPTPLVAPSPFGRSREYAALNQGYLQNLAAQTAAVGKGMAADQEQKTKIATTMINNADDMASVFGGMQTGAGIENYLNLPQLRGLEDTGLQGAMTGQLDGLRLAVLARKAFGGGGGGKGGSKTFKGEGIMHRITRADGTVYYAVGEPKDFMSDALNVDVTPIPYNDLPSNTPFYNYKDGSTHNSDDYLLNQTTPRGTPRGGTDAAEPGKTIAQEFDDGSVVYDDGTTGYK